MGYLRIIVVMAGVSALAIALIVGAALVGLWLGGRHATQGTGPAAPDTTRAMVSPDGDSTALPDAPVYFSANTYPGADMAAVRDEAALAGQNGVRKFIVSVLLPWDQTTTYDSLLTPLDVLLEAVPGATFLLRVRLDPSPEWLAANPGALATQDTSNRPKVSIEAPDWQEAVRTGLAGLAAHVKGKGLPVTGYVLEALDGGGWLRNGGNDASEANQDAFREWLRERYHNDDGVQAAWGSAEITLDSAAIPGHAEATETTRAFFNLPGEQSRVDFREFTARSVARQLALLAMHIKEHAGEEAQVLVPYGWTFEPESSGGAHLALGDLFESPVDGFLGTVPSADRGLGGVGGFIGPVTSVHLNHKQWYQVEDTRTGITRNPATGETELLPGLHLQDVLNVQKRNFASALAHGTALVWSDPDGTGALLDPGMWASFGSMHDAYQTFWGELAQQPVPAALTELVIQPATSVTVTVVVDEASRFLQHAETPLNRLLLQGARDAALLAGAPAQLCLLNDVLAGRAAASRVYVFANAFRLSPERRARLHTLLASQKAAAVWLYAPGYFSPGPSVEGVAAATGIPVRMLDAPAQAGSVCVLGDRMMRPGDTFGESLELDPLFCIEPAEDDSVTALANYRDTEETSVALRFMPEGWVSVFYAEPAFTPDMFRQILLILQEHLYVRPTLGSTPDVALFGPGLVALHGRNQTAGERTLDLRIPYHIRDLLDPDTGWSNKSSLELTLRFGETHLLHLVPCEEPEPPADPEVAPGPEDAVPEEAMVENEDNGADASDADVVMP
jgi:hypothetical protein